MATITQHELARRAGVSRMTVQRVLNGHPYVTDDKRRVIRRLIEETGYRPNTAARATVSGRFETVSLLLSTREFRSTLPGGLLRGISEELHRHAIRLDLACLPDRALTDDEYMPRVLIEHCSDGLLVNYNAAVPPHMLELIAQSHLPAIMVNDKRERDCVYPDDFGAARALTEDLVAAGHRRIAYVDFAFNISQRAGVRHYSKSDRREGYAAAMTAAGLKPQYVFDSGSEADAGLEAAACEMFTADPRPSAVVTYAEPEIPVLAKVGARLGILIPDHLTAVTFGTLNPGPAYRAVRAVIPDEEVGREAVDMLLRKIDAPDKPLPARRIPFRFIKETEAS